MAEYTHKNLYKNPVFPEFEKEGEILLRPLSLKQPSATGNATAASETSGITYIVFHADIAGSDKPYLFSHAEMSKVLTLLAVSALFAGLFVFGLLA